MACHPDYPGASNKLRQVPFPDCAGKEAVIFTIFETEVGYQFALHIEVKYPEDKFRSGGDQASA
jgi:hypothetical protein